MGLSFEAFMAGHKPASSPTILQIIMPANTQPQGMLKPACQKNAKKFPTKTPSKIPKKAPIKLMIMLSNKNCSLISFRFPPNAFIRPTSRVRSLTATSIIFIKPIAAPISVIKPIAAAAPCMLLSKLINCSASLSLLSIVKLSSSVGVCLQIGRAHV